LAAMGLVIRDTGPEEGGCGRGKCLAMQHNHSTNSGRNLCQAASSYICELL
jgi:hypothetical protein